VCVCVCLSPFVAYIGGAAHYFFCFTKLGPRSSLGRNKKMLDNLCVGFGLIKIYRLLRADTHTQSSLIV